MTAADLTPQERRTIRLCLQYCLWAGKRDDIEDMGGDVRWNAERKCLERDDDNGILWGGELDDLCEKVGGGI